MNLVWLLVVLLLSTFVIYTAFFVLASLRNVMKAGVEIPTDMRVVGFLWYVIGAPADAVYNVYRGLLAFHEGPRWGEWTFSQRVQRHVDNGPGDGWRYHEAVRWGRLMNAAWPGHILRLPGNVGPN